MKSTMRERNSNVCLAPAFNLVAFLLISPYRLGRAREKFLKKKLRLLEKPGIMATNDRLVEISFANERSFLDWWQAMTIVTVS